jgi:hypothetical protein
VDFVGIEGCVLQVLGFGRFIARLCRCDLAGEWGQRLY